MSNPITDYLQSKEAAIPMGRAGARAVASRAARAAGGAAGQAAGAASSAGAPGLFSQMGGKLLQEIPKGVGAGLAAAGIGAAGAAVNKIVDAIQKRRDFRQMMEYNPHLQEAHAADPKRFNQVYSTLRTFNPAFAADPIVAGTYMDRMWNSPQGAGGIATEALMARDKVPSPIGDIFHAGVIKGLGSKG